MAGLYDPYAAPIFPQGGAFGTGSPAETAQQPAGADWLMQGIYNAIGGLAKRAFGASEEMRQGGAYNPAPAVEASMLPMGTGAIAGVPMRAGEAVLGGGPIRAYHGSPHDFERFDLSRIGTGEGAQAYGHGLYFAENPEVAKSYRDALSPNPTVTKNIPDLDKEIAGLREGAVNARRSAAETSDPEMRQWLEASAHRYEADAANYEKVKAGQDVGKMYEVNINAAPEHFLDWEKPLNEQTPQTQEAVKRAMGIDYYGKHDPAKAERLWNEHQYSPAGIAVRQGHIAFSDEQVARRLREAGIPGIKYLDQGSRPSASLPHIQESIKYYEDWLKREPDFAWAQEQLAHYKADLAKHENGTYNYVVFDDNLVNIMRKYGLLGLPAGGTAAPLFLGQEQKS